MVMHTFGPRTGKARSRLLIPVLIALTLVTSPASARQWSAVCFNLSGVRVDDPGAEPTFTQDVLKGASWAYSWNTDTGKATLILPASHASDGRSHKQEGVVSVHRGGFFTIVSSLPGAVWTHAIYPAAYSGLERSRAFSMDQTIAPAITSTEPASAVASMACLPAANAPKSPL